MGLLDLCEKYFNTTNLYEVLEISEKATDKEGKESLLTSAIFYKTSYKLRTKNFIPQWLSLHKPVKHSDYLTSILFILVKKAYHKLSLKVHPDRVDETEKLEATEKFKVLGSIHTILSDKNKRALYDETKSVDEDDYLVVQDRDWTIYWKMIFKKITDEDIIAYEKEYTGIVIFKQYYYN